MPRLSAITVKNAKPGRHGDGGGLYLLVKPSGARSWVLRLQSGNRRRDIGLGKVELGSRAKDSPLLDVPLLARRQLTLIEARDKAATLRGFALAGKDPLIERDRERSRPVILTFDQAVEKAHAELAKSWSTKTGDAFKATLKEHAVPTLGRMPVSEVTVAHVIAALAPIWTEKPEQARKVRHRILTVLSFAKAHGWRSNAVPTAKEVGAGLAKRKKPGHFAAVPYAEIPELAARILEKPESSARLAFLFTILTAARSGEVRQAKWDHIDIAAGTWTRPAEAMKSRLEHVVTLNSAALAVLERAKKFGLRGLVFPSARKGRPLSDMTLAKVLRAAGRSETVHGFRSSFRDWAAENMPTVPAMVAEMALAHSVGTRTEQAYLRSDLRDFRRILLESWGSHVAPDLGSMPLHSGH